MQKSDSQKPRNRNETKQNERKKRKKAVSDWNDGSRHFHVRSLSTTHLYTLIPRSCAEGLAIGGNSQAGHVALVTLEGKGRCRLSTQDVVRQDFGIRTATKDQSTGFTKGNRGKAVDGWQGGILGCLEFSESCEFLVGS